MSTQQQLAMMDEQGRIPPVQAIYSDLLGVSYPAKKNQIEMTASNGDSFDTTGKSTIEIPIAVGTGQWVDLSNSYVKIRVTNGIANKTVGFKTPHDFIERLQFLGTNSEILEDVQQYNNLARLLTAHQLGEDGWNYNTNLGEFQGSSLNEAGACAGTGDAAATNAAINLVTGAGALGEGTHHMSTENSSIPAGGSVTLCFPIISGVTSTGKYLPLGMLKNRSLTLRLQLARAVKAVTVEDDTLPVLSFDNVSFVCDVITMAETYNNKFMDMLSTVGDISMHYTTFKSFQDNAGASSTAQNFLIPDSSRSLKSLFTIFTKQTESNNTDALQLINPTLTQYQYTILSETYPMKDVIDISATNRNQSFANLHIALGQLGSISSRCIGDSNSYYNSSAHLSSTFAIGVCAEAHNKSSNLLESGINLSNSTQPCRLRVSIANGDGNNNTPGALNVFTYSLSDRLLMIDRDGNLRSSG